MARNDERRGDVVWGMGVRACAGAVALASHLSVFLAGPVAAEEERAAPPLPAEASRWVGEPQSWEGLRGQVTLVFVWTFG